MSPSLAATIARACGTRLTTTPAPVTGGCIHRAWRLGSLFVKTNHTSFAPMFEAEADGLRALAETRTVRVPGVIATGSANDSSFLALEWLDLSSRGDPARLGEQLAALHAVTAPHFGWHRDNTIGATPQPNPPTADWLTFLRDHRLGHMFRLLEKQAGPIEGSSLLLEHLGRFYPDGPPRPALLHGDLWNGNVAGLADGTPVLFDPACWFGDPESDLAMTMLFGGFSPRFYDAYRAASRRVPAHPAIHDLHQLYHILNHALLFGGSYVSQAQSLTRSLAGKVA